MPKPSLLDPLLLSILRCPRDGAAFEHVGAELVCGQRHRYPVVEGIPVLLVGDDPPTHRVFEASLEKARHGILSVSEPVDGIDPFVQKQIAATNGRLYSPMIGRLTEYPIPALRLADGNGGRLLDIGCSWGRWTIAAARRDYVAIGLDPSLEGVAAARRVARQLGVAAHFVVGDGRRLPFHEDAFDVVFSYSSLQHLPKRDVLTVASEIGRVLSPGGRSLIQMANLIGVRNLANQARERRWREPRRRFDVRYWRVSELRQEFGLRIGPTNVEVDSFFCLNAQTNDLPLLPGKSRAVVRMSDRMRTFAGHAPWLVHVADSVYARSTKSAS